METLVYAYVCMTVFVYVEAYGCVYIRREMYL